MSLLGWTLETDMPLMSGAGRSMASSVPRRRLPDVLAEVNLLEVQLQNRSAGSGATSTEWRGPADCRTTSAAGLSRAPAPYSCSSSRRKPFQAYDFPAAPSSRQYG